MGINNTNKILSKRNNYLTSTNKIIKISEDLNNTNNNKTLDLPEKEKKI